MGKADIQTIRELKHHGSTMGKPRSVSEAEFMERAGAAKRDSWALHKPHSPGA